MKAVSLALFVLLLAPAVRAQTVVTNPTAATFEHYDVDFAATQSYRLEFFQCQVYTPGPPPTCSGRATNPFQTAPYQKTAVTTVPPTGPCTTAGACVRTLNLTTQPGSGAITSMPAGVPFVAAIVAVADPATGAAGEARSTDSNPFFGKGRSLVAPTSIQVR